MYYIDNSLLYKLIITTISTQQEPNTSKDEDLAKKVNDSMNNPPKPGSSGSNRGGGATDLSELLGGNSNLQVCVLHINNS